MKKRIILTEMNFNKLKEEIKKNIDKEIIFTSNNDEFNRKVIEKLKISILMIPLSLRKDYTKQRNSGLNEIMVKIAKKNNIQIGINFDEILNSEISRWLLLSRLRQNIKLCSRGGVKMQFICKNQIDLKNLKSLGSILGMPTWMTKELKI